MVSGFISFLILIKVACTYAFLSYIPQEQRSASWSSLWTSLQSTPTASVSIPLSRPTKEQITGTPLVNNQINNLALHVGNINWNVSCENVRNHLTKVTEGLEVQQIDIKPATNKPRDVGKEHGGSATITFATIDSADIAMERFQDEVHIETQVNTHQQSNIGHIKVRWALLPSKGETAKVTDSVTVGSKSDELSEERILHRKRRAEKYARKRRMIAQNTQEAIDSLRNTNFIPDEVATLNAPKLDWSNDCIPSQIDPMRGGGIRKDTERGRRKQAQVEAFLFVLKESLLNLESNSSKEHIVADLGSGAGNLSLPLAWFLKEELNDCARILAVDINDRALKRLSQRANDINVNIDTMAEDLLNLSQPDREISDPLESCSAILSLHACGAASDLAIQSAVLRSIPFAVSPCCIGKVRTIRKPDQMPSLVSSSQRSGAPDDITYPRSEALKKILQKDIDYDLILTAADYSANIRKVDTAEGDNDLHAERGRMAKRIVETDRLKWAEERGYQVKMMEIPRLGSSYAKRELLIGAKKGTLAASRISSLSSSTQLYANYGNGEEQN